MEPAEVSFRPQNRTIALSMFRCLHPKPSPRRFFQVAQEVLQTQRQPIQSPAHSSLAQSECPYPTSRIRSRRVVQDARRTVAPRGEPRRRVCPSSQKQHVLGVLSQTTDEPKNSFSASRSAHEKDSSRLGLCPRPSSERRTVKFHSS